MMWFGELIVSDYFCFHNDNH